MDFEKKTYLLTRQKLPGPYQMYIFQNFQL